MNNVTIVGMIYKSVSYIDFMMRNIKEYCLDSDKYDVNYLIVANDASEVILNKLRIDNISFLEYNDPFPNDYYLNRVYRAWNFGGVMADGDIIVFINSDMAFSEGWLENLLRKLKSDTIPCSRLVESGKLRSAVNAISMNFGQTSETFDRNQFLEYAKTISEDKVLDKGLFMPCAFYKDDFIKSGGYPEGNIYMGGAGKHKTKFLCSGDKYFFYENTVMKKKQHITVFDSIVYHIQEGEKDE